jgi:hypothetical protein
MDLVTDEIWHEIEDICTNALNPEQLGTPDVIEDIVRQGTRPNDGPAEGRAGTQKRGRGGKSRKQQ